MFDYVRVWQLPPDTTPPSVPTNLTATAISSSQINLTWTASTDNVGVNGYNIFRNAAQVGTSPTNSYSDTGLSANTTYNYTVSAYDAGGNTSASSTAATATTPAAADFSISVSPSSLTVAAGQNGTVEVAVTPQNGFNAAVSFNCSGLPAGASCSFSPATVTPSGSAASTKLTVTTSATTATFRRNSNPLFPGSVLAVVLCFWGRKEQQRLQMLLLLTASVIGLCLLNGCGGAGASASGPLTSTITVTASAGSLQHTVPVSLMVNK
jgi:hypothetical protein